LFRLASGLPEGRPGAEFALNEVRDLTKLEEFREAVDENQRIMLRAFGYPPEFVGRLVEGSKDAERLKALKWVWGIETARGRDRGRAVRNCAKPYAALLPDGRIAVVPRSCRDRACPRCMHIRAVRLGHTLRGACEMRIEKGAKLLFVTLTQPKRHYMAEGASGAVTRILKSFARLTRTSSRKRNERFREIVSGGVRSLEAVWSGQGKKHWLPPRPDRGEKRKSWLKRRRLSHVVQFSGWHAHLHCVFEIAPDEDPAEFEAELRSVWAWASEGSDPRAACNVQALKLEAVGQCTKYITKPFELPEKRARELFKAVHARRMVEGFGEWRSWRSWVPEPENPYEGAVFAHVDMKQLAYRFVRFEMRERGSIVNRAPVAFKRWRYDSELEKSVEEVVDVLDIGEVHERLKRAGRDVTVAQNVRRAIEDAELFES